MFNPDFIAEAAKIFGSIRVGAAPELAENIWAKIFEPQLLERLGIRVQFDGHQIEAESGKAQGRFVDVESRDLTVQNLPESLSVRTLSVVTPR